MSRIAVLVVVLVLTAAAAAAVSLGDRPAAGRAERTEQFQRLVGGLGCGPALDLESCAFSFDPRLGSACPNDDGPVAGGSSFCPQHACSLLDLPPLPDDW